VHAIDLGMGGPDLNLEYRFECWRSTVGSKSYAHELIRIFKIVTIDPGIDGV
jgi:hypothetical protein